MNLQSKRTRVIGAAVVLVSISLETRAQVSTVVQAGSASHVAAEMTKGRLNPADSKPGDTVALKLKDDLKSNGRLVLKKGTTITGVVRNVARGETRSQTQSLMEIEWLTPETAGNVSPNLSIALQSVRQVSPIPLEGKNEKNDSFPRVPPGSLTTTAAHLSGQSNVALLNMPSVVPVDHQTSSAIENSLGSSSSGQLFKVGHGELVTAGGAEQSVDIFSHLSNDTVITSPSKNFEITSGAQMQLLVGVSRK